jgi:hypothetical protein
MLWSRPSRRRRPRYIVSQSEQINAPIATKNKSPIASATLVTRRLWCGASQKKFTSSALRTVVTMPGQKPPAHALSSMAGTDTRKGMSLPHSAVSAPRTATAASAAATAMA